MNHPTPPAGLSVHAERVARVQAALAAHGLGALLVPSSDPHLSEYLPERWQGRQWLSGFTGSMATLVVTLQEAAVHAVHVGRLPARDALEARVHVDDRLERVRRGGLRADAC